MPPFWGIFAFTDRSQGKTRSVKSRELGMTCSEELVQNVKLATSTPVVRKLNYFLFGLRVGRLKRIEFHFLALDTKSDCNKNQINVVNLKLLGN